MWWIWRVPLLWKSLHVEHIHENLGWWFFATSHHHNSRHIWIFLRQRDESTVHSKKFPTDPWNMGPGRPNIHIWANFLHKHMFVFASGVCSRTILFVVLRFVDLMVTIWEVGIIACYNLLVRLTPHLKGVPTFETDQYINKYQKLWPFLSGAIFWLGCSFGRDFLHMQWMRIL